MHRLLLTSPREILEAVYDLDLDERAWITQLTRHIGQFIDGGNGTLGGLLRLGRGMEMPVLSPIHADEEVPAFIHYLRATEEASRGASADVQRFGQLFSADGMGTLSANRQGTAAYEVFRREFAGTGIIDAAGLIVPHPESQSFIFITSRQREISAVPDQGRERWVDLKNHVAAIYDLRHRLQGGHFDETNAVWFDTAANCIEAGPAIHGDVRERLRHAIATREAARTATTSSKRIALEKYWSNVLSGKWAILDRFDSDGRRYVIALPVSKYGDRLRGLSEREREVLNLLGDGLSNKAIAYELNISETAVSSHLNTIYRKLGIGDRSAAVQLVRVLRRHGKHAA